MKSVKDLESNIPQVNGYLAWAFLDFAKRRTYERSVSVYLRGTFWYSYTMFEKINPVYWKFTNP